jgi:hypothetical protein
MSIRRLWNTASLLGGKVMILGNDRPSASLLPDGRVLIAGDSEGGPVVEVYDPRSGTFGPAVAAPSRPGPGDQAAELYDASTGTISFTGPARTSVGTTVISLTDGTALIGGAGCAADAAWYPEIYDPGSNSFVETGTDSDPPPSEEASMTLLKDGRVLFAGGNDGCSGSGSLFVP